MKRILSALAAVVSVAGLVLGAAGTANAAVAPPIYVSEVGILSNVAGQVGVNYVKVAATRQMTLTDPVDVIVTAANNIPIATFQIPANTRFIPGTPYVGASTDYTGALCRVVDFDARPLVATSHLRARVEVTDRVVDRGTIIQGLRPNPSVSYHRALMTPSPVPTPGPAPTSNFAPGRPDECGPPSPAIP